MLLSLGSLEEHGEVAGHELVLVGPHPGGSVVPLARHVALQEDVVVHLAGREEFQSKSNRLICFLQCADSQLNLNGLQRDAKFRGTA